MDISYIINELGEERELYFNAVAPPIMQSSNFAYPTVAEMRHAISNEYDEYFYTRGNNPTVEMLRKKLAALEGSEDALVLSSGAAAVAAAVMANIKSGDHIVSVAKPYSWTNKLFNTLLPRFGIVASMIDGTDPENFRKAIQPNTRLVYLESPNSFTFELQDIEAVVAIAREHNLITLIDNSYASPLYQKPIAMGVDISIHSATKYIGGHSDTIAGVICGTRAMMQKIFASEFMTMGGIVAPLNAWLLIRGLRTLPIRMQRVSQTTPLIVEFLEKHPLVKEMYYPFSTSHPQHALAMKQMSGKGGQFTIRLAVDTMDKVELFCNSLKRFLMACSWGGHESLIFPACAAYGISPDRQLPVSFNLIRFYVGLEEADVLIADLQQALERIG
jgi:cystathionine beta-lyase